MSRQGRGGRPPLTFVALTCPFRGATSQTPLHPLGFRPRQVTLSCCQRRVVVLQAVPLGG